MSRQKPKTSPRFRVGKVTIYEHHGAWWIYFREGGKSSRRKVSSNQTDAEQVAAQVNAQLVKQEPTLLSFTPISIPEIRKQFLEYHESVLHSSMNTVRRYRAATQHLENYAKVQNRVPMAHELSVDSFAGYLRTLEVAPNGHGNTAKRKLRMKGVQYILETCRSLYHFAVKRRHLPPYVGNPFSELPLDRLKIEDSKPIFVFTRETELAFFQNASTWESAIHFTLAKTGLRIGELTHLLIEDLDLKDGWLYVRNKIELGWRIKTGHERIVPLLPELVDRLKVVIGTRQSGPVFVRERIGKKKDRLQGDSSELAKELKTRRIALGRALSRNEESKLAASIWWDAGAVKADAIRISFVRTMTKIGHPESTCPKSWRHSFATILQDANVDPLIRQQVMGHQPTTSNGLGMTGKYTHTRPGTMKEQVFRALTASTD